MEGQLLSHQPEALLQSAPTCHRSGKEGGSCGSVLKEMLFLMNSVHFCLLSSDPSPRPEIVLLDTEKTGILFLDYSKFTLLSHPSTIEGKRN